MCESDQSLSDLIYFDSILSDKERKEIYGREALKRRRDWDKILTDLGLDKGVILMVYAKVKILKSGKYCGKIGSIVDIHNNFYVVMVIDDVCRLLRQDFEILESNL